MTTEGNFTNPTTIYVSTKFELNVQQTQSIANELLNIIGYTNRHRGVNFRFIADDGLVQAHATVSDQLLLSVNN
jgi:hypothetical protein